MNLEVDDRENTVREHLNVGTKNRQQQQQGGRGERGSVGGRVGHSEPAGNSYLSLIFGPGERGEVETMTLTQVHVLFWLWTKYISNNFYVVKAKEILPFWSLAKKKGSLSHSLLGKNVTENFSCFIRSYHFIVSHIGYSLQFHFPFFRILLVWFHCYWNKKEDVIFKKEQISMIWSVIIQRRHGFIKGSKSTVRHGLREWLLQCSRVVTGFKYWGPSLTLSSCYHG